MKKINGFTMAETLLTMAIIGVIATIMLPAIKSAQPNQEMVLVKKSYYNVARIVSELINDDDFYPDAEESEESGFAHVSIKDLIDGETEATFHGIQFWGDSKFCGLFAAKLNTTQGGNPNDLCKKRVSLDDGGNFSTNDGITWSMPYGSFAGGHEDIYIDVNGPTKGANCTRDTDATGDGMSLCEAGVAPDRFIFRVGQFGDVSIPSKIGQLYATSTNVSKKYKDFVKENSGIEP